MEYKCSELTRKRMSLAKRRFFKNGGKPWNFGMTAEQDERIRRSVEAAHKATKGKPSPRKGKPAPWAKHLPQQFKKGFTPWNKGKPHLRGERHWNWKGGIDKEHNRIKQTQEYKDWRAAVYRRDKWRCRKCKTRKLIVAHHKKPFALFPKSRFTVSNGVTLCRKCHQDIHRPRRADYKSNPIFHA